MRKRLTSKTYLRGVKEYIIKIDYTSDEYWRIVKKIIDTEPYTLSNGLKVIDNGYYILELLPKNEMYSMRVFFNEKKEIIEYYFDISLKNDIDDDTKIPFYDDAYMDITLTKNEIEILDEDELDAAHNQGTISDTEYKKIKYATKELYDEVSNKTNKYINMNLKELLW